MKGIVIKLNGEEVPYQSFVIKESFNQLITEIVVGMYQDVFDNPVDIQGSQFIKIAGETSSNGVLKSTFWPKMVVDLLNKQFEPINKTATFEEIAKQYGIQLMMQFKSTPSYWCLPQMKLIKFFDEARNRIIVSGGGGTVMTFSFNGKLRVVDLKKVAESNDAIAIFGTMKLATENMKWLANVPASYKVSKVSIEQPLKEYDLKFGDNLGKGSMTHIYFNEKSIDTLDQEATNIFYRKFFTSRVWHYEDIQVAQELYPGCLIEDVQSKTKMVLYETELSGTQEFTALKILGVNKP